MSTENDTTQVVLPAGMTSSKSGTLYFAYGSNLSPYQMSLRLRASKSSSQPVAIGRLDGYAWIICERGYANVVALPPNNSATFSNTVWGVLYNLSTDDEARLDMFEGHDDSRNPDPKINPEVDQQIKKPYLQGDWDYNKHYLPVTITRWLADPAQFGLHLPVQQQGHLDQISTVRSLVYVDELRTKPGRINQEYIGRMNRAIRESVQLGIPQEWVDAVMRKDIQPNIEVDHEGYVGTDKGYVAAEATETASQLTERVLREAQGLQA